MSCVHYTNPHAAAMSTHCAALDVALDAVASLKAELSWFDELDKTALKQTIAAAEASRASLVREIEAHAAAQAALPERILPPPTRGAAGLAAGIVGALVVNPVGAVMSAVVLAAAAAVGATAVGRDPVADERRRLDAAVQSYRRQLAAVDQALVKHRAALARHTQFDRDGTVSRLEAARAARDHAEAELQRAVRDHATAEARLQPLAEALTEAEAVEAQLREAMAQAEDFQRQLGEAPTGAARARIHSACSSQFGTGKPVEALKELSGQLAGAERTTAKWRDRLAFATHDATHVIDHLVLDGSNLSYVQRGRQRRFIGLVALDALVPTLADRYRVTVVFDASTCKRLEMPRSALEQRFGDQVEVHVAAAARGADHTFLRYADSRTTWVVTNDQLRDFTDLPAVQEGRILRYELLERMVEVPVLDVVVHYGT